MVCYLRGLCNPGQEFLSLDSDFPVLVSSGGHAISNTDEGKEQGIKKE